ncbi:hypothetical protein P7K49_014962 [Saguinus oedipus]|uniref:Uncharacterized protein n=1 Tax=Saguinus oedipus TaxID=9490 RepID=A0ABQ9V7V9_SAGOE|nr:hypothetical protein P7K49_014962 [Saguinus oedipus]
MGMATAGGTWFCSRRGDGHSRRDTAKAISSWLCHQVDENTRLLCGGAWRWEVGSRTRLAVPVVNTEVESEKPMARAGEPLPFPMSEPISQRYPRQGLGFSLACAALWALCAAGPGQEMAAPLQRAETWVWGQARPSGNQLHTSIPACVRARLCTSKVVTWCSPYSHGPVPLTLAHLAIGLALHLNIPTALASLTYTEMPRAGLSRLPPTPLCCLQPLLA